MVSARSSPSVEVVLGAGRDHDPVATGGGHRSRNPLDRVVEGQDPAGGVVVLDRHSDGAGLGEALDGCGHLLRRVAVAVFGIDAERDVDGGGESIDVGHHLVEGHMLVQPAQRGGEPGAGGGDRLESEVLQYPGRADVPGVGHQEGTGEMEFGESFQKVGPVGHRCAVRRLISSTEPVAVAAASRPGRSGIMISTSHTIASSPKATNLEHWIPARGGGQRVPRPEEPVPLRLRSRNGPGTAGRILPTRLTTGSGCSTGRCNDPGSPSRRWGSEPGRWAAAGAP